MNRGSLPAHLPRIEMVVDVDEQACPCCRDALHRIGEDVAERLDIIPAQFRVLVVRRPKYACRACEDVVVQAPAPARLIEGGLPTEATVAQVLVSKYADHLPLYRQAQIYARQGIKLDRSTLADWVGRAAWLLRPVHERLLDQAEGLAQAVRRRDDGAGARSRTRANQDRPALGLRARRSTVGRHRSAGRGLRLRARSQGRAADRASRRLHGRPAGRRLCRLSRARRARRRAARLLLGPCAPPLLRTRRGRPGADRQRGARTHRRALCRRERNPRPQRRGAPRRPAGEEPAARRCARTLAARQARL